MPLTDDEDFEKLSRKVRIAGGVDDRFRPDVIYFLDQLKRRGVIKDHQAVPDIQLPDGEAYYDSTTEIVSIRASVFDALDHPYRASRREYQHYRFTIAHEIAHAVRKHEGIHFRGTASLLVKKIASKAGKNEKEADRLASHLLAPYHLAEQATCALKTESLPAEHLSELFGINPSAATIAKERIDRMHRRAHKIPRPLPEGIVDFLKSGQRQGFRVTSLAIEEQRKRKEAKLKGFEDRPCGHCQEYTLRQHKNGWHCDTCKNQTS